MNRCPNLSSKEAKELINKIGIFDFFKEYRKNNYEIPDASNYKSTFKGVNSSLKVVDALSKPKTLELFNRFYLKGNKDKFFQEITGLTGKEQVKLLRDWESNNPVTSIDDMISGILSEMSFTVEIETARGFQTEVSDKWFYNEVSENRYIIYSPYGEPETEFSNLEEVNNFLDSKNNNAPNSSHYANLTVPGGTNYTENEIRTPEIVPSIKGHAQFSTDNGIGWFRTDEQESGSVELVKSISEIKEESFQVGNLVYFQYAPESWMAETSDGSPQSITDKDVITAYNNLYNKSNETDSSIRRVLELQSDLFQKGRDNRWIIQEDLRVPHEVGEAFKRGDIEAGKALLNKDANSNKFLQLLNKDNNWVTFFVKSIVQDSQRKGYKKVLFPAGETAAKIEGHETLANDIKKITSEIESISKGRLGFDKTQKGLDKEVSTGQKIEDILFAQRPESTRVKDFEAKGYITNIRIDVDSEKLATLEQQKVNLKSQGIEKLKPIEGFYEVRVQNILKKNYPIQRITDSYGNEWFEVTVDEARDTGTIYASKAEELSDDMKNLFGNKEEITVSEALEYISGAKVASIYKVLAKRLLRNLSNDCKIEILPFDELQKLHDKNFEVGGLYKSDKNRIYIPNGAGVGIVLHEILHAFTVNEFKSNSTAKKDLKGLYNYILQEHSELSSEYAMSNLDEFLVGIFTDKSFMTKLQSIPSRIERSKLSLWDDIVDIFHSILVKVGIDISKSKFASLLEEGMDAAIRVIEDSKENYDIVEAQYSEESVYASKVEEKEFVEDLHTEVKKDSKALSDIKDRLTKVLTVLKNRQRDKTTAEALENLEKINKKIAKLKDLEAIQEYVKSASEIAIEYRKLMDEIVESKDLSKVDDLAFINQFVSIFDNIKELQLTMFTEDNPEDLEKIRKFNEERQKAIESGNVERFDEENKDSIPINTTQVVDKTVKILEKIKKDYLTVGRDMIAQRLFAEYDTKELERKAKLKKELLAKNPNDAYALSLAVTWEELASQMKEASRDIDSYERWLTSTMGGTTNDMIALVSRLIDSNQMLVSDRIRYYQDKLGSAYEKHAKETGKNKNNVAEFNKPFLQDVESKLGDKTILVKQLINKYDIERFKKDEAAFYKKFNHLKDTNPKAFATEQSRFYRNTKTPKANAEDIIEARRRELTDLQFEEWSKKNYFDYEGERTYKGELSIPKDDYLSNEYKSLSNSEREYYDVLREVHEELKLLLPKDKADNLGDRIPGIYRDGWKLGLGEASIKQEAKDAVQFNEGDTNYGLVGLDGKAHKEVPFYFVNKMSTESSSSDLLQVYMKAAKQWEQSNAKLKIQSEIQVIQDLVSYGAMYKFKVNKVANGENIVDSVLKNNYINKEGETNIQNKLSEVIDDMFYGVEHTTKDAATGKVSMDKVTNTALKATSIISLSANWISGTVNSAMGNLNNLVEAIAGENINTKDLAKGTKTYFKYIGDHIADRNKTIGKSNVTKVIEDFIHYEEHIDSFGNNVSGNRLKKELSTSALMVLNTAAEHQISVSNGLGYMNAIKFIDGAFIDRKSYKELGGDMKVFNFAKSLLDIYEENDWELTEPYASAWTVKDRQRLRNKVKEINKYVQGNYSKSNKTALSRRWYGKLAEFFRKYVVSGFARRYGKKRFNHATGDVQEGYYRSTFEFLKQVISEMKEVGIREAFGNATPEQKANMRRVVAEVVSFGIVLAIVSSLTPDDDEKNTYLENVGLLLARRMQSEISFYANPDETWRILKTPTVAMSTVDNAASFIGGLIFKWGDDESYSRNTGVWDKGDSKDLARLVKLMPVLRAILAGTTPEEQLKTFNR
jgi:hypothetical protein